MRLIKKLIKSKAARESAAKKESLGGLSDIKPSKPEHGKFLRNKAGRSVVTAVYGGRKVKAYQAFSECHAKFIESVSSCAPKIFPNVIETRGRWVICNWVERTSEQLYVEDLVWIAGELREISVSNLPNPGFDYVQDFILPRFLEAAHLSGRSNIAKGFADEVVAFRGVSQLCHPDVTLANVIESRQCKVIIDNELLYVGAWPLLDACNSVRSLGGADRSLFWRHWLADYLPSDKEIDIVSRVWLFREIGSSFITSRFAQCDSLFRDLESSPITGLRVLGFDV